MLLSLDLVFKFLFLFSLFSWHSIRYFAHLPSISSLARFCCYTPPHKRAQESEGNMKQQKKSFPKLKMAFDSSYDTLKNLCSQGVNREFSTWSFSYFTLVFEWTCMSLKTSKNMIHYLARWHFKLSTPTSSQLLVKLFLCCVSFSSRKFLQFEEDICSRHFVVEINEQHSRKTWNTGKSFNLGNLDGVFLLVGSHFSAHFKSLKSTRVYAKKIKSLLFHCQSSNHPWNVSTRTLLWQLSDARRFCWNLPHIWLLLDAINILLGMTWYTELLWMKKP